VGKRRGHKASGRSRKRASGTRARPRRGFDPSPERIAADVARELARHARRCISEVKGPLDAELFASWLVSVWKLGPAALTDADPEAEIGVRVVAALERAGDARALAVLRAMEAVGSEQVATASAAAAARLADAGVAEPGWRGGLGAARARRALIMRDAVFDDAINVLIEFERPAHEPYVIGVLIDHNLGGIAKDLLVGPTLGEIEDSLASAPTEAGGTGELRLEDVELAEAAARSREALWRTERTLDPPISDDFNAQAAAVAAHLRTLPDEGEVQEPEEIGDSQRQAVLDRFLASPEAAPFRAREELADLAMMAIDYCADYLDGDGRPLRWSPVVVELFMTWFLPRKVARESEFFERAVPELLPAWVRHAGRVRGIPEAAVEEAAAAVAEYREEMLALVRDESAWGPGKAFAMAASEAGVDLSDQAAIDAFLDEYNSRRAA
jgi:hypothetical protein